ncbi:MAG: thiamine-monophosphate kinase, partial [Leptospiraceae bacterium]|nr:thiamine-monophosphate kinase [Leptospiraceae bacterium]
MKESKIIQKFYKNNLQDDDCYWDKENKQLISTDSIVEGTHFLHKWSSPKNLAKKIIEVNISDILSSGGIPTKAFLNLGLNHISSKPDWINSFSKEIKNLLSFYKIELCGGDTFYSQNTQITLTLIGKLKLNKPFLRSGGKPGDNVYITGEVGFSLLGFKSLQNKINLPLHFKKKAIITHLAPSCEWKKRNFFQKYNKDIHAMMDITDGLVQDLGKLAKAS